jgi:polyisoprenoid-binding protein YceI
MRLIGHIIWLFLILCYSVFPAEYHIDRSAKNLVKFISDAPFEDFEGKTERIDGYVTWPGKALSDGVDPTKGNIYFEVELATLKTGIGMRDKDMREDYLETDEYPYASYSAKISSIESLGENRFKIFSEGDFTIHGISKSLAISAIVFVNENIIHIKSEFDVNLPDHNIEIPKLLFLRIDETIEIELEFYLKFIR